MTACRKRQALGPQMLVFMSFVSFDGHVIDRYKVQQMNLIWIAVVLLLLVLVALVFAFPKSASSEAPQPLLAAQPSQASFVPPAKQPLSAGPSNVIELQNGDEADAFLSQGPGILMTYAPWCGHCKNMMPAFDAASTQTAVKFARIEGSRAPAFMQKHGVRGFPTIITVSRSNELGRHMGGRDVGSLVGAANVLTAPPPVAPAPAAAPTPSLGDVVEAVTNPS